MNLLAGWANFIESIFPFNYHFSPILLFTRAVPRHALVLVLGSAIALSQFQYGRLFRHVLPGKPAGRLEKAAINILLGFVLQGTLCLGLGLTGLFYPALLVVCVIAGISFRGTAGALKETLSVMHACFEEFGWWIWALFIPVIPVALAIVVPDTLVDAYIGHLGAPEKFLLVHKITGELASVVDQIPLTADLIYATAVALGIDPLPHLINLFPFLAGTVLLCQWAGRRAGPVAGVLAACSMAAFGLAQDVVLVSKNDAAVTGYILAGTVLLLRQSRRGGKGSLIMSALVFGSSMAIKYNGNFLLALALVWLVFRIGPVRALSWGLLAAIPCLPWLAKNWLLFGDPVWPFLSSLIGGPLCDLESARALEWMRVGTGPPMSATGIFFSFANEMRSGHPAIAALAPLLFIRRNARKDVVGLAVYSAVGYAAICVLVPSEPVRLAMPVFLVWTACVSISAADLIRGMLGKRRTIYLTVWCVAGLMALGTTVSNLSRSSTGFDYLVGNINQEKLLRKRLTSYMEAGVMLKGIPAEQTVAVIAESRSYRLGARIWHERVFGRNIGWTLSRECRTPAMIREKFRQANCRRILYNFVTDLYPQVVYTAYPWDDRQLSVWKEFIARWTEIETAPSTVDAINGGYCLFRVLDRPLSAEPKWIPCLPGIQSVYFRITSQANRQASVNEALALLRRFPNVIQISDLAGYGYSNMERWEEAFHFLAPGVKYGIIGANNCWHYALAASHTGRSEEAIKSLRIVKKHYPLSPVGIDTMIYSLENGKK